MTVQKLRSQLPFLAFVFALCSASFCYGAVAYKFRIFPYPIISEALAFARGQFAQPWYYIDAEPPREPIRNAAEYQEGLNLITGVTSDQRIFAKVVDMRGETIHSWNVDIFDIWPEPKHLDEKRWPKSRPGGHIHGAILAENGDLIFNYEEIGLVRLAVSGEVVWRLPYATHHSIHRSDDGNYWVCGQIERFEADPRFPNYKPPFLEFTLIKVTPAGEILEEHSLFDLLVESGYGGLLSMGNSRDGFAIRTGDTLHLNDVEPFPEDLEPGFFTPGDLMVSLREVNAIIVFEAPDFAVKFISTGRVLRQHDPDFVDGDTISVYDNNTMGADSGLRSRIVAINARDRTMTTLFGGSPEAAFYTHIMGKHQWLENGNLLVTAPTQGHAFELNHSGRIVWEHFNYLANGYLGIVSEVQRVPASLLPLYDAAKR